MTITLRSVKGSALTHGELDGNFEDLDARSPVVTPEEHGAVGDGSTSDTTALNSAIAASVSSGRRLVGDPSKTYYIGTSLNTIVPPAGSVIRLSDIHIKAPNQVRPFLFAPTWAAENTSLTALSTTVLDGTSVTRVALSSTTGLAAGDWVMVGSNTVRWPGDPMIFWFETAQIVALAANATIDLHRRLLGEETGLLNTGLRLFKIPSYRIEASNIRFSVNGDPFATGQTSRHNAIEIRGGIGHQIDNLSADTWWGRLVVLRCSVLAQARGLHWNQLPDITDPTTEALGYGFEDGEAGYGNAAIGLRGGRCRHGYTCGGFDTATYSASTPWQYGMPVNGYCADSIVAGHSNAAFDTHVESIGTTFANCTAVDPVVQTNSNTGDPMGFQNRGFRTRHSSCSVRGGDFGFKDATGDADWTSLGGNTSTYENIGANEVDQAGMFFDGDDENGSATILVNGFTVHGAAYAFQSGASAPFSGTLTAKGVLTSGLSGGTYLNGGHTGTVSIDVPPLLDWETGVANGTPNTLAGFGGDGSPEYVAIPGSVEAEPRSFGATSGTLEIVPDVPKAHYSQINQSGGAITFTKGLSAGATAIGGSFHLISIQPNGDGVSLGAGVVTLHGGALSLVPGVVNWLAFEYHEPSDQLLVAVASSTVSPVFTGLTTVAGVKVASGSSVSGSLTEAAHGGGIFVTSGNVTVPNAAGFSVTLIAGGAHTVGAGGTAHSLASGDVLSVFIPAVGTVRASKVAAANVITLPTS